MSYVIDVDPPILDVHSGATIEDCTLWQFGNGAAFQLGWYGKTISGTSVSRIDLIHSETWWGAGDKSGLLNFAKAQPSGGRPGEIRDISFRDVRLEGKTLRLVGLTPHAGSGSTISASQTYPSSRGVMTTRVRSAPTTLMPMMAARLQNLVS